MKVELRIRLDAKDAAEGIAAMLKTRDPEQLFVSTYGNSCEPGLSAFIKALVKAVQK